MDYRIRRTKSELDSTGYMEIGPGKYSGAHWQEGFLFVWEDAFTVAEGILTRHLPAYDHMGVNEIPRSIGRRVAAEWRSAAAALEPMNREQIQEVLRLPVWAGEALGARLVDDQREILRLLGELADACDQFYERDEWVCVLGV